MAQKRKILLENITVADAGAKGKAVTRLDNGLVVFIEGAVPGDVCDVLVHKKGSLSWRRPVKFHSYSDLRREAVCEHFGLCGGCKWQFMDYKHQLHFKQKEVEDSLTRLGGIEIPPISPILGCKMSSGIEIKWTTPLQTEGGLPQKKEEREEVLERNGVGFRVAGFWDKVIDLNDCHLQAEPSNAIRKTARDYALEHKLKFFDITEKKGFLRNLIIRIVV